MRNRKPKAPVLPQMPKPPSPEVQVQKVEVVPPAIPVQTEENTESEEDLALDRPLYDAKGALLSPPAPEAPKIVIKEIAVVANSDGFYGQVRRKDGDKFTIKGEHEFAWWMTKI